MKVNNPKAFAPDYRRYLLGVLRDQLDFEVPIKLYLQKRESSDGRDEIGLLVKQTTACWLHAGLLSADSQGIYNGDDDSPMPIANRNRLTAVIQLLRPHQWVKNLLVFLAPILGQQITGRLL